jgi:hexokinase
MFNLWELLTAALDSLITLLWPKHAVYRQLRAPKRKHDLKISYNSKMDEFLCKAKRLFEGPLQLSGLLDMSAKLHEQLVSKLQSESICMLPSYIHTLPTGTETGTYLALDVGGSTFRVAAVQLQGRNNIHGKSMEILKMESFRIDNLVKALEGHAFFDWMAEKIGEVLTDPIIKMAHGPGVFEMGLAWSFAIE